MYGRYGEQCIGDDPSGRDQQHQLDISSGLEFSDELCGFGDGFDYVPD